MSHSESKATSSSAAQESRVALESKFGRDTPALDVVRGISLNGLVAIVTVSCPRLSVCCPMPCTLSQGGASGIGVETARALAHAGAHVIIAARTVDSAKSVVADIKKTSGNDKVCKFACPQQS